MKNRCETYTFFFLNFIYTLEPMNERTALWLKLTALYHLLEMHHTIASIAPRSVGLCLSAKY